MFISYMLLKMANNKQNFEVNLSDIHLNITKENDDFTFLNCRFSED